MEYKNNNTPKHTAKRSRQCWDKISEQCLITKAHGGTQEQLGLKCESKIRQFRPSESSDKALGAELAYQARLKDLTV